MALPEAIRAARPGTPSAPAGWPTSSAGSRSARGPGPPTSPPRAAERVRVWEQLPDLPASAAALASTDPGGAGIRFETGPGVQSQADWKALGTSCGLRQTTAHSDALVVRRWPPLDVVARVKPTLGGPHLAETKRR